MKREKNKEEKNSWHNLDQSTYDLFKEHFKKWSIFKKYIVS